MNVATETGSVLYLDSRGLSILVERRGDKVTEAPLSAQEDVPPHAVPISGQIPCNTCHIPLLNPLLLLVTVITIQ